MCTHGRFYVIFGKFREKPRIWRKSFWKENTVAQENENTRSFIMKNRRIYRSLLSVALVVVMLFTTSVTIFAKDFEREDLLTTNFGIHTLDDADEVQYPAVILPGLSFSKFYLLDDEGNRVLNSSGEYMFSGSFIYDKKVLIKKALGAILPLIKSIFLQTDAGLSDTVYDLITYFTQYSLCNEDGELKHSLELETYDYPMSGMDAETKQYYYDNIPIKDYGRLLGEDQLYIYTYCPFGEVMEQSEGLVSYIDMVLEQTKAEKVNILTMSMGTTLLNAYMDLDSADYSKINRIINIVPMFDGNEVITELLAKDFTTDGSVYACEFLPTLTGGLMGNDTLGYALNLVLRALPEDARKASVDALYDGMFNAFAYSSQAWTMVQSDRFLELRNTIINEDRHEKLRKNVDRFFEAQKNIEANLIEAAEEYGVGVFNFVGYGTASAASFSSLFCVISSNAETNSDCLVPLSSSSLGATYVSRNSRLSDEYLASLDTQKYVSPDKTLDASTCLFKDTTWFYNDQIHWCGGNDAAIGLALLTMIGVIDNVDSDPQNFPQFNGPRDLFDASDRYMYLAEEVLKNEEKYSAIKIQKVREAFDELYALYRKTNLNYEGADKEAADAQYRLGLALSRCGVCEKPEKPVELPVLTKFLRNTCYKLYDRMGKRGYFEIF